ncbi:MerR family transcriptional regulator [Kitasatospora sp. NPDC096147]|uniref:MerR family transcriptional regulator n=1 Tax=Kitasatospora sp. NPDC096147 TaxID=3364093 RepID=UPI0037F9B2E5
MRIGDAAAVGGTTPRALRFYEQRGLLTPQRSASGQREYGAEELARIRAIRELLALGLTVADVRACADKLHLLAVEQPVRCSRARPASPAATVVDRRLALLDAEIARLTALRDALATRLSSDPPPRP